MDYKDLDKIALDGSGTLGYKGGGIAQYDVAGYERVSRREVPPSQVVQLTGDVPVEKPAPSDAEFVDEPYLARIGGFRRNDLYGPDEIGRKFRDMRFVWNDGLGNGHYESLLINRKYGLGQVFESPAFGFDLPFLEDEFPVFREDYAKVVSRMRNRVEEWSATYGQNLLKRKKGMAVIISRHTPMALFANALERDPEAVKK